MAAEYAARYAASLNPTGPAPAASPAAPTATAESQHHAQHNNMAATGATYAAGYDYSAYYAQQQQQQHPQQQQQPYGGHPYYAQQQPHAQQQPYGAPAAYNNHYSAYAHPSQAQTQYPYAQQQQQHYPPPPPHPQASHPQQQQQQYAQYQQQHQQQQYTPPTAWSAAPNAAPSPYQSAAGPAAPAAASTTYAHAAAAAGSTAFRNAAAKGHMPTLASSFVKASEPDPAFSAPSQQQGHYYPPPPPPPSSVITAPSQADDASAATAGARKSRWASGPPTSVATAAPSYSSYNPQAALAAAPAAAAPPAASSATTGAAAVGSSFWSSHPGLLEYVDRSLAASPAHLKPGVEAYLRELITSVTNGTRPPGTTNWHTEPLAHMQVLGRQAQDSVQASIAKAQAAAQALASKHALNASSGGVGGGGTGRQWFTHGKAKPSPKGAGAGWTSGNDEPLGPRRSYGGGLGESKDESKGEDSADEGEAGDGPDFIPFKAHNNKKRAAAHQAVGGHGQPPAGKKAKKKAAARNAVLDAADLAKQEDRLSRFREYNESLAATAHEGPRNPIQRHTFLPSSSLGGGDDLDLDWSSLHIRGTCQRLEKRYLRLTQAPLPEEVRPEDVLARALEHVLAKWNADPNEDRSGNNAMHLHDYPYTCEQLKSIRQDLTVQHLVSSPLCVRTYEEHARIALQVGDFSEYNQCGTQLKALYVENPSLRTNAVEFASYRILYYLVTDNRAALNAMLREVQRQREGEDKEAAASAVAASGAAAATNGADAAPKPVPPREPLLTLSSRSIPSDPLSLAFACSFAALSEDYYTFFRLVKALPFQGPLIVRPYVAKLRFRALQSLLRAYKPGKVGVDFLTSILGFDVEAEKEEARAYFSSRGLVWTAEGVIDAKTAELREPDAEDAAESAAQTHGVTHAIFSSAS